MKLNGPGNFLHNFFKIKGLVFLIEQCSFSISSYTCLEIFSISFVFYLIFMTLLTILKQLCIQRIGSEVLAFIPDIDNLCMFFVLLLLFCPGFFLFVCWFGLASFGFKVFAGCEDKFRKKNLTFIILYISNLLICFIAFSFVSAFMFIISFLLQLWVQISHF